MATARIDRILAGGFDIVPFAKLPREHQLALVQYMAIDSEAWDYLLHEPESGLFADRAQQLAAMEQCLPAYVAQFGEVSFGVATVPVTTLAREFLRETEQARDHASFEDYHAWAVSTGEVPEHATAEPWPCILSHIPEDVLCDGHHRFHSYVRSGMEQVPVLFNPCWYHLAAKGAGCE